jgi:GAF domain-containing protein
MNAINNPSAAAAPAQELDEAGGYAELSRIVLPGRPLSEVLEEMAQLAKRVLPEAPEVSMTLLKGDHAETVAFTGSIAIALDERQYEKGYGPCLDAAASGERIRLVMADPDNLYPDLARAALEEGVTHCLSVGMPLPTPTLGAMNVYNPTGRPISDDEERIAATFASFAAIVLASAGLHQDLSELDEQLKAAVQSRAVIDQAKGIIMAQNRCSADDAFRLLVRASQTRNLKLRTLAEQLAAGVSQPPQIPPAPSR